MSPIEKARKFVQKAPGYVKQDYFAYIETKDNPTFPKQFILCGTFRVIGHSYNISKIIHIVDPNNSSGSTWYYFDEFAIFKIRSVMFCLYNYV